MRMEIRLSQSELLAAVQDYVVRKMQVPRTADLAVQIQTQKGGPCGQYEVHTAVVEVGGLEVDDNEGADR